MSLDTPVLFIVFNRPEPTQRVFDAIREARPTQLYVAADGPRTHVADDQDNCQRVKEIVTQVDWDCQIHTLFRDQNLGCMHACTQAIDWFFDQVDEGIILEDDCLPSTSFFPYCQALLDRYRHDTRVVHINGNNYNTKRMRNTEYSYHFVYFPQVWGWATWKRAWKRLDIKIPLLPDFDDYSYFKHVGLSKREYSSMRIRWWKVYRGEITNVWDYQWHFINFLEGCFVIAPKHNLISNIGFDSNATHTQGRDLLKENLPFSTIDFPLNHPPCLFVDTLLNNSYKALMTPGKLTTKIKRRFVSFSSNM